MNITKALAFCISISTFILLTACGGGGTAGYTGTGNTTAPNTVGAAGSAEGTWIGSYANVYNTRLVVLNTSEAFGIYETGGAVAGALYGQLSSNGSVKGILKDFSLSTLRGEDASVSGASTSPKSMLLNRGFQQLNLSHAPNMNTSVSVASLAGTYTGRGGNTFGSAEAMNVTIFANGAISLPEPVCSATGQISPHANGQNVFALSLTITGNNCGRRGNALQGVLYQDPGTLSLFVLGLNPAKSDTAFFFGYRN
jgi:hypothetical protein